MRPWIIRSLVLYLAAGAVGRAQELPAPVPQPVVPRLETRITVVTLYSDQALVVRSGTSAAPMGRSRWEIAGLPVGLADEAVRARMGRGATLASLEVVPRNETVFKKKEAEEAEKRVKEIERRHKQAADSIAVLEQEMKLLAGLAIGKLPAGRDDTERLTPLDTRPWDATLGFVAQALTANRGRARELLLELDEIEEELTVAKAHFDRLSSSKVLATKSVFLEIEARAAGEIEMELSYLVAGPGWWPRYDVRASVDAGKLELTSYALVRQETGEDWEGVELTFSAAEPARAADLPELLAWRIGEARGGEVAAKPTSASVAATGLAARAVSPDVSNFASQIRPAQFTAQQGQMEQQQAAAPGQVRFGLQGGKAARAREVMKNIAQLKDANGLAATNQDWGAFVTYNRQLQNELQNLDVGFKNYFQDELLACEAAIVRGERLLRSARLGDGVVAPVSSSRGYDYKYRALRPETVPSDGAFNQIVLLVEELPAEFVYETAPGMLELCFLTTRVKNQRRQPYLEGPASVFLGPDFVGDGRVPTTARGEELPVSLGADESVVVRRRPESKRETTGLFTSYHKYLHEVEVSVKNMKARPVRVVVIDQIPFSDDAQVRVERGRIAPAVAREDRKGLLRWELSLLPGGDATVQFAYTVELPAKSRIVTTADAAVKW